MYENPPAKAERKPGNPENNAQTTEIINNIITAMGLSDSLYFAPKNAKVN